MEISPITKYGVTLRPLTRDKIELVRQWRNHPKIQQYMEYREEITPEMQEQWFRKISTSGKDFYFIIGVGGKEIGLINIKNINWDLKTGESGIFIYDDDCLHAGVSYRAKMCQCDFAFNILGLDSLHAHIFNSNPRSVRYHTRFGFKLAESEIMNSAIEKNQLYVLSKEDYFDSKDSIIEMLSERYAFTPPQ